MTEQYGDGARDEVLFAFHQACSNPTAEQIIEWVGLYPQFADDIRGHAAILKDWACRAEQPQEEPDELLKARSRSRLMNALHNARVESSSHQPVTASTSFDEMMVARGTDVPQLARDLGIARSVLAALVNGRMLAPVGERLILRLMVALSIKRADFGEALQLALQRPRLGRAKAGGTPTVVRRSYEDLVRASSMSEERKRYWLGED